MSFDYPTYFVKPQIQTSSYTSPGLFVNNFPIGIIHNVPIMNIGFQIVQQQEYDYSVFIIITKNSLGEYNFLVPIKNNYIELCQKKLNPGENPDYMIEQQMYSHGINPNMVHNFGKFTKVKHVEKHNGKTYKIGVLYIPSISHFQLNQHFQNTYGTSLSIEYVDINRNYKYANDFTTNNIMYALKCMIFNLV
jgi:hypothetical protein